MMYPKGFLLKGLYPEWVGRPKDFTSTAFVETSARGATMYALNKQPKEVYVGVGIDFSARIDPSETLTSLVVTTELLSGIEGVDNPVLITSKSVSVVSNVVSATIGGGYDGCVYKLTYRVGSSLGSILESEIKLKVKEI